MNSRRRFLIATGLAAAAVTLALVPANAGPPKPQPFDPAQFAQAQAEGRIIVVETYADWCAPCRIQAPMLSKRMAQRRHADTKLFRIGLLTPEADWDRFELIGYGTIIIFKGKREVARGTPIDEAGMRRLFARAR